jgi:hypothetical protein
MLSHHNTKVDDCLMPSSFSTNWTQTIYVVAFASALYSTSILDLDIVVCFLELHNTRLEPRYIAKPLVEQRSLGHPTQSASENALGFSDDAL